MSHPVASELAMGFVGERNRELTSALTSTIWSGSWFLSAKVFQALRARDLPYWKIFLMTAALYVVGIALYEALIRAHEREAHASQGELLAEPFEDS